MKPFKTHLEEGYVRTGRPDKQRAAALRRRSEERLATAADLATQGKSTFALENAYEAVLEMIDAVLAAEGFKSRSHEASVSYLAEIGFSLVDTVTMDNLRRERHGIKYYGEDATEEEAEAALSFARRVITTLKARIRE